VPAVLALILVQLESARTAGNLELFVANGPIGRTGAIRVTGSSGSRRAGGERAASLDFALPYRGNGGDYEVFAEGGIFVDTVKVEC